MDSPKKYCKGFIGSYIGVYLAWAGDVKLRYNSASGGVVSSILRYLLEYNYVDAVLVPKPKFKHGFTYGVWAILRDPNEIPKHSGSLYAPVFSLSKVLDRALSLFKRVAVTAVPCHSRAIRRVLELRGRGKDVFIIGLYCNNTPSVWAAKYALGFFGICMNDVEWVRFRGCGWPGYTVVKTRRGYARIPYPLFWGSGFGQYFYGLGCYLCSDQVNSLADISLADPWTLPHEPIKRLGGATLVVTRTRRGLEVFEGAVKAGYVEAVEVDPVYAVQDATLLKLSKRVLRRCSNRYVLPPGFTTIAHELVYHVGHFLASREPLWPLLRLYHKVAVPLALKSASLLDHRLRTTWARVHAYVKLLQKTKVPREGIFAEGMLVNR